MVSSHAIPSPCKFLPRRTTRHIQEEMAEWDEETTGKEFEEKGPLDWGMLKDSEGIPVTK